MHIYSNVLRDQRHTEKANFHVAKYMDDLLKDALRREQLRAVGGAAGDGAGAAGGLPRPKVGCCTFTPINTRVESAWFQHLRAWF